MAFSDDPFAPTESAADNSRRKKLSLYGLQGLARYDNAVDDPAELQEQPLYGGALSKASQLPDDAGEPSQLATERVERAPISQEASPLLGPDERLGNMFSEAERGEEGSYGPMSGSQRAASLRDFFGNAATASAAAQPLEQAASGPDGVATNLGRARTAFNLARTGDRATGGNADRALKDLFTSAGTGGASFPSGLSLTGGEGAAGAQFPEGLSLAGSEASGAQFPEGLTLAQQGAGGGGSVAGAAGAGLGVLASLYSLYQSRGGDLSPSQFIALIQSSGALSSQLGALLGVAPGAVAGVEAGAAATPGVVGAAGGGAGAGLAATGAGLSAIGGTMGIGMGLANAINAFASGDDRAIGTGTGTLIGLAGGAGLGLVLGGPLGAIAGAGIGAGLGGWLGSYFGQNLPHYYAVREHAGDVGKGAIEQYMGDVIAAGETGDIAAVQAALGQSFADERVRVDLNLPPDVAQAIGVNPRTTFNELTPDQFGLLLKAYRERDGANGDWFVGSGDLPYLTTEKRGGRLGPAQAIAKAASGVAKGTFDTMSEFFAPFLDQMAPVAPASWEEINGYRIAPEIAYTRYNTHTGEPGAGPPTYDPADFDTIKAAAQAGTLSDLFYGGGKPLGTKAQRDAAAERERLWREMYARNTGYNPGDTSLIP